MTEDGEPSALVAGFAFEALPAGGTYGFIRYDSSPHPRARTAVSVSHQLCCGYAAFGTLAATVVRGWVGRRIRRRLRRWL
ncbi:hypothetical protein, partial [Adlercreutzia sp. DFI.6.23]|uniref:hypothetical protein n=1 Tax=Adlercreutzia sp. DFI.6.23 TaxID=2963705 RepID=UPI00210C4CF6